MKADISAFCAYLDEQIGQVYLWAGQGTLLTPSNYKSVIAKREKDASNRAKVEKFCEDKFANGATELRGFDCSGLGMYYLQNLTHTLPHDLSANGMMGLCEPTETPKRGDWLFRVNEDGKATHIGYMVTDTELVEARGRTYGVVRRRYVKREWHRSGTPSCIEFDDPKPSTHEYVKVIGGSVRVREGNGTMFQSIGKHETIDGEYRMKNGTYWLDMGGYKFCKDCTVLRKGVFLSARRTARKMHKQGYYTPHQCASINAKVGWSRLCDNIGFLTNEILPYVNLKISRRLYAECGLNRKTANLLDRFPSKLAAAM